MKSGFSFGILLLIAAAAQAQAIKPLMDSSEAVINTAIKLNDDGKYAEAIQQFNRVPEDDTNYVWMLSEKALSLYSEHKYDSVINICTREIADSDARGYHFSFLNTLGNTLDDSGLKQQSLDLFFKAIDRFPNSFRLYFNLGLVQEGLHQYDSAMASFQHALKIYPFHPASNLNLGMLYLRGDKLVPALFSLSTFLLVSEDTAKNRSIISIMEAAVQGADLFKPEEKIKLTIPEGEDDFSDQEDIIRSKLALSKQYKSQLNLNYDIVKQLQVLMEKLPAPPQKGFCMEHFLPVYYSFYHNGYFEPYIYTLLASIENPAIQSWNNKNKSARKAFAAFAADAFQKIGSQFPILVNGQPNSLYRWVSEGTPLAIGMMNSASVKTGPWIYFFDNYQVSKMGTYNDAGKENGEWKTYYYNGMLKEDYIFSNGVQQGKARMYFSNGLLSNEMTIANDRFDGENKIYFHSGALKTDAHFKLGVLEGSAATYYETGNQKEEMAYSQDHLNGPDKSYYEDGKPDIVCTYANGKLNGSYTGYFENGNKSVEGNYANNNPAGKFTYYTENGQISRTVTFDGYGNTLGTSTGYYEGGGVESTDAFDKSGGEVYKENDEDGKPWYELDSKNGNLTSFIYYDKTGKVIAHNELSRGTGNLTGYYPNGDLYYKGQVTKGSRDGLWTYYWHSGIILKTVPYKNGDIDGETKNYYRDGTLASDENYKAGKRDGYQRSFYTNGQLEAEGWFLDDQKSGNWYNYNEKGILNEKNYFINDYLQGKDWSYNVTGRLDEINYYRMAQLGKMQQFDSAGKMFNESVLKNGSGVLHGLYANGNKEDDMTYKNGFAEGAYASFHYNGKPLKTGSFKFGDKDGDWVTYDCHGDKSMTGTYKLGDEQSKFSHYADGKLVSEVFYDENGADTATHWYFSNGKPDETIRDKDGDRNGPCYYYNEEGMIYVVLNYKDDGVVSYSYEGSDGKLVPAIILPKETGKVTAYFPNGKKSFECEIKSGIKEGELTMYFPDGTKRSERNYIHDYRDGKFHEYNQQGVLIIDESYFCGEKDGACTYYSEAGKPRLIKNYAMDSLNGVCKYYDDNGNPAKTEYYLDNELMSSR